MTPDPIQHLRELYKQRQFQSALTSAQNIMAQGKPDAAILHIAACSADGMGMHAQAEQYWQQALYIQPNFGAVYYNLARQLYQKQDLRNSESLYLQAAQHFVVSPYNQNYNTFRHYRGHYEEAEAVYLNEIRLDPHLEDIHISLGFLYLAQKNLRKAEIHYLKAIEIKSDCVVPYNNLGRIYCHVGQFDKAETCLRRAIEIMPKFAPAYLNFGNLLSLQGQAEKSLECFRHALTLSPHYVEATNNYAGQYARMGRFEEAETYYKKAIELGPYFVSSYSNLGVIYLKQGRWNDAEIYFRKTLELAPDYPQARFSLAHCLLVSMRFEEGWPHYEARYLYHANTEDPISAAPTLPFPQWQGELLAGKSLLVMHEQGFGDNIMFARYIRLLKQQGARHISLVCKEPLKALMQTIEGVDAILPYQDKLEAPDHDYWTYPLSIPMYLKTRLETIPDTTKYFSVPAPAREKWQDQLPHSGMNVGIVWKGSSKHTWDAERSLSNIEKLKPLWTIQGVNFISLQKEADKQAKIVSPTDQPMLDFGEKIDDFSDVAAIIEQLDLVICVDTAITHLAGALGKPTWVLLPYVPDWRWMLDREDSPWYPSLRLFRQTKLGDWDNVIERVRSELSLAVDAFKIKNSKTSATRAPKATPAKTPKATVIGALKKKLNRKPKS